MRKLTVPITLLLLAGISTAFPADLTAAKHQANATSPARFELEVKNDLGHEESFRPEINGIKESWWFYEGEAQKLAPGDSSTFNITVNVTPTTMQRKYPFIIRVKTLSNRTEDIQTFFTVERTRDLHIEEFDIEKDYYLPGDKAEARIKIRNTENHSLDDYRLSLNNGGTSKRTEAKNIPVGFETIRTSFRLAADLEAGERNIEAVLEHKNYSSSAADTIQIKLLQDTEPEVEKNVERRTGLLSGSKTIRLTNNKDSAEEVELEDEAFVFLKPFTSLEPEPDSVGRSGMKTLIEWKTELEPGEETVFRRTTHYWMPVSLTILLIGGLIGLNRLRQRQVVTKFGQVEDDEATVYLEVTNKSKNPLENFEVRDFVPKMLDIEEEFDTMEPELEDTDHGKRLIWKIDRMEPGESRVLTYGVKSGLEVESRIVLPRAKIWREGEKLGESTKLETTFAPNQST